MSKQKVLLAISGGVDSATAAYLLKKRGFKVLAVYFRMTDNYQAPEAAARAVANGLGIDFYPLNIADDFQQEIIQYFIETYENGQTPNPCVKCNRVIKFGKLLSLAKQFAINKIATGHYVRVRKRKNKTALYRGVDKQKDQSYFLYGLNQDILKRAIFPLGNLNKNQTRQIAEQVGLPYAKKESQDICFLVNDNKIMPHNEYLRQYIKAQPGKIKLLLPPINGKRALKVIGQHIGLPFYTIGQRRGVNIGGSGPYYVAQTDYKNNDLIVVNTADDPILFSDKFIIKDVRWIGDIALHFPLKCAVVIRYRHKPIYCLIEKQGKNFYQVKLKTKQRAVTPGQSAVFYQKNRVLGGGIIS